ncbi:mycothiol conjugate amidase Mca [Streptomyces somaliensis]|uniref:Mycothiol S-conjugate amidase n=1 Tax=Streptomyces somaliensis (strain ATCC 33201 / DSM 40738 / JCM 12659 / KCTC 9044 / NCTC 11332 / NRRL B-12077 / IP 733) TaxID=1134445 RepID=A0AA44IBY6_STRE0|nr:mycothiol conjugate amidase Mca [Streptomyces somaliensis]MCP9944804.1 mycothiol conjugate amidase Mca [Streptomyces somaliensis]MCP9961969.1 mycothiol conjugate amidase Mca [Streptomyces somaliensis]MCP9974790.1 mycothiol conjugate amidase Mca [Streptomyces somaliensis]MCQ0023946.1 mycothiol conjugate amidase Mca [Streptomyces somaliensis DSM 40738]NKY13101.1 mycothiol conjugate amidase Mca [Streptomyces somaliensis DSM 40738]
MTEQLRLMAVHAHPDDESSKGAATMAKYVSEGVDVLVVTCTGGERGSVLNPKLQGDPYVEENIHEVRRKEMDEAREILGVRQEWLGFVDSGLPEGDPLPPLPQGCFALEDIDKAAGRLVRSVRAFRPQVITTYDENGGYPHPDHIMTHKITMVAFEGAADPEKYPESEFGPVWQPLKLYYNQGFNRQRTRALHEALLECGLESPYGEWLQRWDESRRPERTLTTYVPCADFFETRDRALIAHRTQIDPDGGWFRVPMEIQKEVWPTEEYELARSLVDTAIPENDLFAGIRDNV